MNAKKIASAILFFVISAIAIDYYVRHKSDFYLITTFSTETILYVSAVVILLILCYGFQLKILVDHYKLNLNFMQCVGLTRASVFANMWLPLAGGSSLKAIYLKKYHNLTYSSFIASMGIANIIKLVVNALCGMIILGIAGAGSYLKLFAFMNILFWGALFFLLWGHKLGKFTFRPFSFINHVIDEWRGIRGDHGMIVKLALLSYFIFLTMVFRVYLLFLIFGSPISFITSGLISACVTMTGVLNIVPGNYGIKETLIISLSAMQGVDVNIGLHAAALDRVLAIVWSFVFSFFISLRSPEKEDNNISCIR